MRNQALASLAALYEAPALLLTLTTLMWGFNAMAGQIAVGEIMPFTLVLLRWVLVCAVMVPLFWRGLREHWPAVRRRLPWVVVLSTLGFTGFNSLFYIAAHSTSGVNVGILQGSIPAMVLIGAFLAYRSPVSLVQALGAAAAVVGVVVVSSQGDLEVLRALALNEGDLIMLAACLLYASYTIALQSRPAVPSLVFFTFLAIIAMVMAVPMAVVEMLSADYAPPTATGWLVTVLVAIFPSCLAQIFFMRGVDLIGPGRAGVYANLVPVFAPLMAIVFLGQSFFFYHAAALAMVMGGIWLAQRAPRPVGAGR